MINLIGISGKKGSGKDTVAKIIQYLTFINNHNLNISYDDYCSTIVTKDTNNWEIKRFATKLKQIVALLIGCTVQDLEDQEFKSSPLGKEWWYWENSFGKRINYLDNPNYGTLESNSRKLIKPTPRLILQTLGTQGLRDLIHPNCHINGLFADYKPIGSIDSEGRKFHTLDKEILEYPNWIITDTRFPNEIEAIKKRGGITIRVKRYCYDSAEDFLICHPDDDVHKIGMNISKNENSSVIDFEEPARLYGYIPLGEQHESETALDNVEFDYTIDNNKDIPQLIEEVRKMLVYFKIL